MLLPILTSKISPDFRDFSFHNQKFPGFWNLDSLALGESVTRFVPFFDQKNQGLFKDFQGHISHFSRTPFSAKKSLESMSSSVLPEHEQFYPEGLSVFAGLDKVSTEI